MATGSPNTGLGEDDLGALQSALYPARKSYKSFALQIGVKLGEIEDVEGKYTDYNERLLGILSVRIKKEEPLTWKNIDAALREECVGEIKTANKIRNKYGHLFAPDRDIIHEQVHEKEKEQHKERVHEKKHEERVCQKEREQHKEQVCEKERKQHEERVCKREKNMKGMKDDYHLQREQQSSEQEEDLYKEVSKGAEQKQYRGKSEELPSQSRKGKGASPQIETERGKAQKDHSFYMKERNRKKGRYKEEISDGASDERGVKNEGKTKRKKKAKKKSASDDMVVGEEESESDDESIHKQKTPKQAYDQESCATSSEMVSSPFQSKTRGKGDKLKESAQHVKKKSEYQEIKEKFAKMQHKRAALATHKKGHYSGTEVSKKPTHKSIRSKDIQSESESKDDSSTSNSEDANADLEEAKKAAQKVKPVKHSDQYRKQHREQVEHITLKKGKKSGKKTKSAGEKFPPNPMEKKKEKKRRGQDCDTPKTPGREKYYDTQSKPVERERQVSSKKPTPQISDSASDGTQDVSEGGETDPGDSSGYEQYTDSEQESLNEVEEIEPDEESSPTTSEKEIKQESRKSSPAMRKVGDDEPDLPKDDEQSDASGRETHHKKKRRRRKQRESSISPIVKGSSSPSTSQEENQKQPDPREKKKKEKKKEKKAEKLPQSSGADDSSPECDMKNNESQIEAKELSKVFECFFGKLCCAIVNPVSLAAELQNKQLISKSVMKDLWMSPESQQAKTFTLVDKLDEKVKSQPNNLFEFIKVLLENEDLQESGRDLLRKAGK